MRMTQPRVKVDLAVEINYGQVYVYAQPPWADDPTNDAVLRALDDAHRSGRHVGVADRLIDVISPVQWNFHAPMRVEVFLVEPPGDDQNWDHVVDVDGDGPDGRLWFEGAGGRDPLPCDVPSGVYRARVSGRGYTEGADGLDSYRLRLWPRLDDNSPELRKSWTGW